MTEYRHAPIIRERLTGLDAVFSRQIKSVLLENDYQLHTQSHRVRGCARRDASLPLFHGRITATLPAPSLSRQYTDPQVSMKPSHTSVLSAVARSVRYYLSMAMA